MTFFPFGICIFRWYHGHLSGPNAEKLIRERDEPGTFLVRESLSKPGDFVLSALTDEMTSSGRRVSHIKIMCKVSACAHSCMIVVHQKGLFCININSKNLY